MIIFVAEHHLFVIKILLPMIMLHRWILIIVSSALAAADSRLSQRVADPNSTEMMQCYERYVCASGHQDVIVLHKNTVDVSLYVACIHSPFVILDMGPFNAFRYGVLPKPQMASAQQPHDLVVLLAATAMEMSGYLQFLFVMPHYNRRGRILVVYLGNAQQLDMLFDVGPLVSAFNMVVLLWNDTRVYTYFPYDNGACGERARSVVLGQCLQLTFEELYPVKIPKQFNGCKLGIVVGSGPPAAIDPHANTEQARVAGYEVALLNIILKRLNFTKVVETGGSYGPEVCQYSYPYYTDTEIWHVPAASPREQWMSLVLVFQPPLWYAVIGFFLFHSIVWWIMGRVHASGAAASYVECLLGSLLVLLGGSVPWPRRTGMRFVVIAWSLCALVLVAAYQCEFLGILLMPVYEKQIDTEQEIIASDLPIDMPILKLARFSNIFESFTINDANKRMRRPWNSDKPYAFVRSTLESKYVANNYRNMHGKSNWYLLKNPFEYKPLCLQYKKGHPVVDYSNKLMRQLREYGIVSKIMRDVDFSTYRNLDDSEDVTLSMEHLNTAFGILLSGLSLAMFAFLIEQIVWRTTQKWRRGFNTAITK